LAQHTEHRSPIIAPLAEVRDSHAGTAVLLAGSIVRFACSVHCVGPTAGRIRVPRGGHVPDLAPHRVKNGLPLPIKLRLQDAQPLRSLGQRDLITLKQGLRCVDARPRLCDLMFKLA
jgi:hypothetical protein